MPDSFRKQFGRIIDRIGQPTPLIVDPEKIGETVASGPYAFIDGVEYYAVGPFKSRDIAIEYGNRQVGESTIKESVSEFQGEPVRTIRVFGNIDESPDSAVITRKGDEYWVLVDNTVRNYQRQQRLLKAWRMSVSADNLNPLLNAYWGFSRFEHPPAPAEVVDILSKIGFTAKTEEEELAGLMTGIVGNINRLREEAGLAPVESPTKPIVSGDARPGRTGLENVRKYRRKKP